MPREPRDWPPICAPAVLPRAGRGEPPRGPGFGTALALEPPQKLIHRTAGRRLHDHEIDQHDPEQRRDDQQ